MLCSRSYLIHCVGFHLYKVQKWGKLVCAIRSQGSDISWGGGEKGPEGGFWNTVLFRFLIWAHVTWGCSFETLHLAVHMWYTHFAGCILYFNNKKRRGRGRREKSRKQQLRPQRLGRVLATAGGQCSKGTVAGDEPVTWAEAACERPCVTGQGVYVLTKGRGMLLRVITQKGDVI